MLGFWTEHYKSNLTLSDTRIRFFVSWRQKTQVQRKYEYAVESHTPPVKQPAFMWLPR